MGPLPSGNGRHWWEVRGLQESEVGLLFLPATPSELLVVNWVCLLPKATVLLSSGNCSSLCPFRPSSGHGSLGACCCLTFPIPCLHSVNSLSLTFPSVPLWEWAICFCQDQSLWLSFPKSLLSPFSHEWLLFPLYVLVLSSPCLFPQVPWFEQMSIIR